MARVVFTNTRTYASGVDLTGVTNKVEVSAEVEEQECTNFGSAGWKEYLAGLKSVELNAGGQWEAGDASKVDNALWADLGTVAPWSIVVESTTPAVGDLAYLLTGLESEYKIFDEVGNVAPWEAKAAGSGSLVRGVVAHPPGTARTTSANGTGQELGALSASQELLVNLHVLSITGGGSHAVGVTIESDVDNTFTTPTTQVTFNNATSIQGQSATVSGAVTDTWWRPVWTVSGGGVSVLFLVTFGISS